MEWLHALGKDRPNETLGDAFRAVFDCCDLRGCKGGQHDAGDALAYFMERRTDRFEYSTGLRTHWNSQAAALAIASARRRQTAAVQGRSTPLRPAGEPN
jgi:hypothetical protein